MDRVPLIYKVLSGEANHHEKTELNDWIAQDKGNKEEYEDIKLLWENSPATKHSIEMEAEFDRIKQRMQKNQLAKRRYHTLFWVILTLITIIALVFFGRAGIAQPDATQSGGVGSAVCSGIADLTDAIPVDATWLGQS